MIRVHGVSVENMQDYAAVSGASILADPAAISALH